MAKTETTKGDKTAKAKAAKVPYVYTYVLYGGVLKTGYCVVGTSFEHPEKEIDRFKTYYSNDLKGAYTKCTKSINTVKEEISDQLQEFSVAGSETIFNKNVTEVKKIIRDVTEGKFTVMNVLGTEKKANDEKDESEEEEKPKAKKEDVKAKAKKEETKPKAAKGKAKKEESEDNESAPETAAEESEEEVKDTKKPAKGKAKAAAPAAKAKAKKEETEDEVSTKSEDDTKKSAKAKEEPKKSKAKEPKEPKENKSKKVIKKSEDSGSDNEVKAKPKTQIILSEESDEEDEN
jgi:DNA polymerase III gamma/tau subunit